MTNEITYQQLCERLGPPITEKSAEGAMAMRTDTWPCGCRRVVTVGDAVRQEDGSYELNSAVTFHPCAEHKREFEGVIIL